MLADVRSSVMAQVYELIRERGGEKEREKKRKRERERKRESDK